MRSLLIVVAATSLTSGSALAQSQNPRTQSGPASVHSAVEGPSISTEGQARSKIESHGFTNVSALTKDDSNMWRGKAEADGKPMDVSVDSSGKVIAK